MKKIWHILMVFSGLALIPGFSAFGQAETRYLTLQEALDSSGKANQSIRISQANESLAQSKYQETSAIFLPQAEFSFSALGSDNPLNVFGFRLQQQSVKASDFDPARLNVPGSFSDFTTRLMLKQPLLNLDMYYARKAAGSQTGMYRYMTMRTRDAVRLTVEKTYIQLQMTYAAKNVLLEAKRSADSFYQFIQNRVEQGLLQKSDALNVRVWQTTLQNQLQETGSAIQNLSDALSQLMGLQPGLIFSVSPIEESDDPATEINTALPGNRADFKAMEKAIESSDLMIRSARMNFLPRINAFGSYQFNDNRLLGLKAGSYLAGIQLNWDIFKGNSLRNKVRTAGFEKHRLQEQFTLQKQEALLELDKAARQRTDTKYKIARQRVAIEQAAEALRILTDRHEQGLVNSTDVLMAQTQLAQQKLGLTEAMAQEKILKAFIQFLTTTSNE